MTLSMPRRERGVIRHEFIDHIHWRHDIEIT
jgi:hypothetical protein